MGKRVKKKKKDTLPKSYTDGKQANKILNIISH